MDHRAILQSIARQAMLERGLHVEFPANVLTEVRQIAGPARYLMVQARDLRHLKWCSIDHVDSLDLDQLSYAQWMPDGKVKLMVAIADVDELVEIDSLIDLQAAQNTVSVYTVPCMFPMLPEKLSTNLTSLQYQADRCAVVIEMIVNPSGEVLEYDIFHAMVHNHAKLDYEMVGAWLENGDEAVAEINQVNGLAESLIIQDRMTQSMNQKRIENGALEFERNEVVPVFSNGQLVQMQTGGFKRAKKVIECLMITSNILVARFLEDRQYPSLRRVVKTPKKWDRIVELASELGYSLPDEANPKSLSLFLKFARENFPLKYDDISHSVLKLLGGGEYVVDTIDHPTPGHFGLAVQDYAHSTAPNRRYPDLITHRLLKSAIQGREIPYSIEKLRELARHCTLKEDDARKVERLVEKAAHAILLKERIGEVFEGIVTGASPKGTWIKISHPDLEGKLIAGYEGLKVGHRVRARLRCVDEVNGHIDFETVQ